MVQTISFDNFLESCQSEIIRYSAKLMTFIKIKKIMVQTISFNNFSKSCQSS